MSRKEVDSGGYSLSRKPDRVVSQALGGGESVSRLKKAMRKIFGPSEDKIEKMLEEITSIQACKDAALTGDEDLRLLAMVSDSFRLSAILS